MGEATPTPTSTQTEQAAVSMDETDVAHLAGFFDAAGTLTVYLGESDNQSIGYRMIPTCRVTRPVTKNDPIMGKVAAYCDEQHVGYQIEEIEHGDDRVGSSLRLELRKRRDIELFLEPLKEHLVSTYEQSVLMLEEVIPRMDNDDHLTEEGFYELMEYVDAIREFSNHDSRQEYDQQFFGELWGLE